LARSQRSAASSTGRLVGEALDALDAAEEVRVEEEREREAVATAAVDRDAVRRRSVEAAGHAIEHVADVADEAALDRRRIDPAAGRLHLQAADVVLQQHRQEPVVAVLADAPARVGSRRHRPRRVVEEAKQDQRVRGVAAREVVARQIETERDALHEPMPERSHRCHVVEQRAAKAGQVGNEVAAVQGRSGLHERIVVGQLGAEIETLLPVRQSGR
jgi:hypothetical protein